MLCGGDSTETKSSFHTGMVKPLSTGASFPLIQMVCAWLSMLRLDKDVKPQKNAQQTLIHLKFDSLRFFVRFKLTLVKKVCKTIFDCSVGSFTG